VTQARFALTALEYVRFTRGFGTRNWLQAGPDYSRAVEYPLVARMLDVGPGQTLLDIGSGRRAEFATLAARAGVEVTAVDMRADIGAEALASTVRHVRADARDLPFADGTFDRVSAISAVEHIEDGEGAAVAELARVLAPGGRLVLSVPYNPLKRAEVFVRDGVYGREGERVFFERIYDEAALQERLIRPSGLRETARELLTEPGMRLSRVYYDPRSALWRWLRFRVPAGPLLALAAPRFLRPCTPADFHYEDWTGVAAIIGLQR
jgi:SAM-dependent methyltransferase